MATGIYVWQLKRLGRQKPFQDRRQGRQLTSADVPSHTSMPMGKRTYQLAASDSIEKLSPF